MNTNLEEEYLEIFEGDINLYNKISNEFLKKLEIVDKKICSHAIKINFIEDENSWYCKNCGFEYINKKKQKVCSHKNIYEDDNGLFICSSCNEEINIPSFEPEWKFYNSSESGNTKNPSRCNNVGKKNSLDDIFIKNKIDIPSALKAQVEKEYSLIVEGKTFRGNARKSIIAACLFQVYPQFGEYRTSDYIRSLFDLTKKNMSYGLRKYYEKFPEARTRTTKPQDLIRWIMNITGIDKSHYRKIFLTAKYLENTSTLLSRSSPQSVASAVIYFYICLIPDYRQNLGITKNKFSENASLSEITVIRLVKEASLICKCFVNI